MTLQNKNLTENLRNNYKFASYVTSKCSIHICLYKPCGLIQLCYKLLWLVFKSMVRYYTIYMMYMS